ncbi:fumarylacetoacetate hydrolase family protein [Streptomyces sp. NPDC051985]|uniref:fumarylacetoacetate hydrolase family protein n=1 Tax=Streptomyces sp. NPDC051985 TaxID=3155807 RepID=UPI0034399865
MTHPLDVAPSKVLAVHLNYRSRAEERGRTPAYPSYFLKPPSTLAGDGDPLLRPAGCELLAFEAEIALVIGKPGRRIAVEDAWDHIRWVTAANDAGVYDLRYADRGSNVRSKGIDGYTPLGPALLDARAIDPAELELRAWVNGSPVQRAGADDWLFSLPHLVADLSRLMTLEEGDVILTGTPSGSTVVLPGDTVEIEVSAGALATGRLGNTVVEDHRPLSPIGAMPRSDEKVRADAVGGPAAPADTLSPEQRELLLSVSTATLSSQLRKRGLNQVSVDGLSSTRPSRRMVGTARTLRYLPLREDLFKEFGGGLNAQKATVERIQPGEVLVIEARRDATSGTIGDILALRAQLRGAEGIVTDGGVRDLAAVAELDIPTYHAGGHPAVLGRRHVPWEGDVAIACGGTLVRPGDVVVGDADGVLVIPPALVDEVVRDAVEQERQERFIAQQVADGEGVDGLYPMNAEWARRYEAWCAAGEPRPAVAQS